MMVLRLVLLLVAFSLEAVAFSVQQAHPHTGKVTPFPGGDPGVSMDPESESILASGQPYLTKLRRGHAGQGLVVQDINAPAECVWYVLVVRLPVRNLSPFFVTHSLTLTQPTSNCDKKG